MGIHYDFSKCEGADDFAYVENEEGEKVHSGLTEYLIWTVGLSLGIDHISADNLDKVYCRLCLLWTDGAPLHRGKEDVYPTKEQIGQYVGMTTNGNLYDDETFTATIFRRTAEKARWAAKQRAGGDEEPEADGVAWEDYLEDARQAVMRLKRPDTRDVFNWRLEEWLEAHDLTQEDWKAGLKDHKLIEAAERDVARGHMLSRQGWPMVSEDEYLREAP